MVSQSDNGDIILYGAEQLSFMTMYPHMFGISGVKIYEQNILTSGASILNYTLNMSHRRTYAVKALRA